VVENRVSFKTVRWGKSSGEKNGGGEDTHNT
jgi:hypothetical protein